MKRKTDKHHINERTQPQWKLHQQLAQFSTDLNRQRDVQEVRNDRTQSAPLNLLPMVF